MKNIIYKHTNLKNGKVYIGQTKRLPEVRWKDGKRNYNSDFLTDIEKYGWDNFSHEILLENLSDNDADYFEIFFIKKYESMNPEKGYNKTSGGRFFHSISDETKKKISDSLKISKTFLKNNRASHIKGVVGIRLSDKKIFKFDSIKDASIFFDITPSAIGNSCNGRIKTAKGIFWRFLNKDFSGFNFEEINNLKKCSDETKKKLSEALKGRKPIKAIDSKKKEVVGISKNGEIIEFESAALGEKTLGIYSSGITQSCKNKKKFVSGYKWYYKEDFEKLERNDYPSEVEILQ